uniref:Uncharacterized protein n=1 Tax=Opuntia streptacantha TaxID=393608 RepID=A0A7C8ZE42_OPUST
MKENNGSRDVGRWWRAATGGVRWRQGRRSAGRNRPKTEQTEEQRGRTGDGGCCWTPAGATVEAAGSGGAAGWQQKSGAGDRRRRRRQRQKKQTAKEKGGVHGAGSRSREMREIL